MILKILGSNLELKDKKVRITAKKLFVFFKQVEKSQNGEIDWLEPENGLITWYNQALPPVYSHMEQPKGFEPSVSCLGSKRVTTTPRLLNGIKDFFASFS